MERYSSLWKMPENLFSQNSPVIVRAGVISKDNEINRILAQIKYENISDKPIKALKVRFNFFDVEKNIVLENIEHQYLDISVNFKDTFGSNSPIILTDKTVRSFEITGITVIFDNTIWVSSEKYIPISKPDDCLLNITDNCLFSNFIQETQNNIFWTAHLKEKSLLNNTITELHNYKATSPEIADKKIAEYSAILNANRTADAEFSEDEKFALSDIDNTLNLLKGEKVVQKTESKKRRKKKVLITLGIILLTIILIIAGGILLLINTGYNTAVASLNNGNYEGAIADFEVLGNYKDSEEKLLEAKFGLAEKMESISIAEAYSQYSKLPSDYPGVSEKLTYLEKFIPYTEKYKTQSIITTDGTGKIIYSEELFSNNDGITINICIKDGKLCYAPDALIKYNSTDSGTFTYEYAELKTSEDKEFEYYCEYDNGFGNDDFVYISKEKIYIINKDLSLISEEKSEITESVYVKE